MGNDKEEGEEARNDADGSQTPARPDHGFPQILTPKEQQDT